MNLMQEIKGNVKLALLRSQEFLPFGSMAL